MKTSVWQSFCSVGLCALVTLLTGCGGGGVETVQTSIKGKVTYQGAPVTEGSVSLVNADGDAGGQADLKSDGTFELDKKLPEGQYSVAVLPPLVDLPATGTTSPGKVTKEVANIPRMYRSNSTSGITVDVEGGEKEVLIEMK